MTIYLFINVFKSGLSAAISINSGGNHRNKKQFQIIRLTWTSSAEWTRTRWDTSQKTVIMLLHGIGMLLKTPPSARAFFFWATSVYRRQKQQFGNVFFRLLPGVRGRGRVTGCVAWGVLSRLNRVPAVCTNGNVRLQRTFVIFHPPLMI